MQGNKNLLLSAALGGIMLAGSALAETPKTAAPATKPAKEAHVKCYGINSCKTQSICGGKASGCSGPNGCEMTSAGKGKNNCKGLGITFVPDAKTCTDKGGKIAT